ncbi:hypothetical protein RCL1_001090 [Eukaryota sp. TZLM3-RCL]
MSLEPPSSVFQRHSVIRTIFVAPNQLKNIPQSISDLLHSGLFKYNRSCQGVLLAFNNLQILDRYGQYVDDSPFLSVKVSVDYIYFVPSVGSKLPGVVTAIAEDHIALLVYGVWQASISSNLLSQTHVYSYDDNSWYLNTENEADQMRSDYCISEGSYLEFIVKQIYNVTEKGIAILGKLDTSEVVEEIEPEEQEEVEQDKQAEPVAEVVEVEKPKKEKKSKKKKEKADEEEPEKEKKKRKSGDSSKSSKKKKTTE